MLENEPKKQRYKFSRDESCHWYMIPVEKISAFESWVATENESGEFDEYLIGNPCFVTFENPEPE